MIEKRRRKRHGSHIFLITLILTIALGSVVLGCSMIWAVGSPQLVGVKLESQLANLVEDVQAAESVLAEQPSVSIYKLRRSQNFMRVPSVCLI